MTSPFTALQEPTAAELNLAVQKIVRRGNRTTTKSGITSEVGVLRVDSAALKEGHAYEITISNFGIDGAAATDVGLLRLRYDDTGASATTASAALGAKRLTLDDIVNYPILSYTSFYFAATDVTFSVLMTAQAAAGTIEIKPEVGGLHLVIKNIGLDPGDTGVDI